MEATQSGTEFDVACREKLKKKISFLWTDA